MSADDDRCVVDIHLDEIDRERLERLARNRGMSIEDLAERALHRMALRASDGAFESLFDTERDALVN